MPVQSFSYMTRTFIGALKSVNNSSKVNISSLIRPIFYYLFRNDISDNSLLKSYRMLFFFRITVHIFALQWANYKCISKCLHLHRKRDDKFAKLIPFRKWSREPGKNVYGNDKLFLANAKTIPFALSSYSLPPGCIRTVITVSKSTTTHTHTYILLILGQSRLTGPVFIRAATYLTFSINSTFWLAKSFRM